MFYYRVTIAYKGTRYYGWQAQSVDTLYEKNKTIEGTIKNALKKITNYQHCTVSGASRTDGGVHAQGQRAKLTIADDISAEHLLLGLNSVLPDDIRILSCERSTKSYQPSSACISKEYHCYFIAGPINNAALTDIALYFRVENLGPKELEQMAAACRLFTGTHDFCNFSTKDRTAVTSIREITYCAIHKSEFSLTDNLYYLKVVGKGFLKYMIRYLMGTLFDLVRGKITLEDIERYLQGPEDEKLSPKVKPHGLHLISIQE